MATTKRCLGLDIGGANLKAATTDGFAREVAFPLWKNPEGLSSAIAALIAAAPRHDRVAVTMTGELADCFASKAEGVASIVAAIDDAMKVPFGFFRTGGEFLSGGEAIAQWRRVAAANWFALGLACRAWGIVIDVGSTTTDIVATLDPELDDTRRLIAGELLYQGVGRTPVCAVVDTLPYRDAECPVAAELFATVGDAALLLGFVDESGSTDTADGRAFTKSSAAARLGRMLCLDPGDFDQQDAAAAAACVIGRLQEKLTAALRERFSETPPASLVVSGSGAWLAERAIAATPWRARVHRLAQLIGEDAIRCAPAWAVAKLAEREG